MVGVERFELPTLWSQTELHGHKTRGIRTFLFSLTVNVSGTCGFYTHSAPTHSLASAMPQAIL
jgi:hypothetical protein